MRSFEEMKALVKQGYRDANAKERAIQQNPALADSGAVKTHYRKVAVVVFLVVCIPLTIVNYLGHRDTGRFIIFLLAANIVLPPACLWMLITGKNPFLRLKK